jgi:putative DNA primase/helicase
MNAADVASALGGATRSGAQWIARCPSHPDRTPSLALRNAKNGGLLVFCHAGCNSADVIAKLGKLGLLNSDNRTPMARPDRPLRRLDQGKVENIIRARTIWTESSDPRGTIVEIYLNARGLALPVEVSCIRYHPRCPRGSHRLPALVAEMRNAITNEFVGVHRTFLRPDGSGKAGVEPQRMALGCLAGAVIKISANEDVARGIGICEGIEDAIAVHNAGWRPVWCCVSASNLNSFPPLPGVDAVTIFADADVPGLKAARCAAQHWQKAGREARIVAPKRAKDFGEALR